MTTRREFVSMATLAAGGVVEAGMSGTASDAPFIWIGVGTDPCAPEAGR